MNKRTLESGKEYTLSDLFSGKNKIIIPDLQRDYCWGDKAWDKDEKKHTELVSNFVDNLKDVFEKSPNDKLTLGLIYGYESPKNHIQLCDGQQRITTLFLLLGILNRLTENKFINWLISKEELHHDDKEPYLQYAIRESTLYFLSDLVCEYFLKKEVQFESLKQSLWYFSEYDQDASIQSMLTAINTIEKKLSQEIDYEGFGNFIAGNLQMLYYDMGDRNRGEKTFVVINTTGEPLTATENLKPILIGNIENIEKRKQFSEEWEIREEWFWRNRDTKEQTADDSLKVFFVWYWQIRLLQERRWIDKKSYELNPKELFIRKPEINSDNQENPETERWEDSINPESIHEYFCSLKELVKQCQNERIKNVLNTIKEGEITLNWFRGLPKEKSLYVVLPLIAYCKKFKKLTQLYEFIRRIRKNYFDKEWKDRTNNFVDWRHIVQIIEMSKEEVDVLKFKTIENQDRFKTISNVKLMEWYNEEEQKKDVLKENYKQKIEEWEDHLDFMGDLSFLFSIKENLTITDLDRYYQNYVSTIDLVRKESTDKPELVNLFRLFYLYIGCNKVGHMDRVTWDAEGTLFSTINRSHLKNIEFKLFLTADNDKLTEYLTKHIKDKIEDWKLFDIIEENFTADKAIKAWLTLKVFNANKEGKNLAFYDGNKTGVAVYKKFNDDRNRLIKTQSLSLENLICGFGVKAGGGGSYIHYTCEVNWNKTYIIDTPFMSIAFKEEERTLEQIHENKEKIDEIVEYIDRCPTS
tara:strand:+ start:4824 stop:7076 length:2253 start_codon:yes stop_codon:yes gene_type:complete